MPKNIAWDNVQLKCLYTAERVGAGIEFNAPTWHNLSHFRSGLYSQSLDWYWQTKQYKKIHKIHITRNIKQCKIQQNKTTLVQSPLMTLSQENEIYNAPEPTQGHC